MSQVTPYQSDSRSKKEQVSTMFDKIASYYDFMNHFLSLGIDISWRKKAVKHLKAYQPKKILDVATGTADLAIEMKSLQPESIIGVDISEEMLNVGRKKIKKKGLEELISLQSGDAEHMPFEDGHFDAITAAFGVRNFENLEVGLSEMKRVLGAGGQLAILEFSKPQVTPFKQLYHFYFQYVLPTVGRLISSDQRAYSYLPESVANFPNGEQFVQILERNGFKEAKYKPLTFGICGLYTATS